MSTWKLFKDKSLKNNQKIIVKVFQEEKCADKECFIDKHDSKEYHAIYFNDLSNLPEEFYEHHYSVMNMATKEMLLMRGPYQGGKVCWCQYQEV